MSGRARLNHVVYTGLACIPSRRICCLDAFCSVAALRFQEFHVRDGTRGSGCGCGQRSDRDGFLEEWKCKMKRQVKFGV